MNNTPNFANGPAEDRFRDVITGASRLALCQALDTDEVKIGINFNDQRLIQGHWMAMIMLSGQSVTLVYKCHFFAEKLLPKLAEKKKTLSKVPAVLDFMKEHCNLVGGLIKVIFEKATIDIKVSLPVVTRGFDEIFSKHQISANEKKSSWILNLSGEPIVCSVAYEILNDSFYDKVRTVSLEIPEISSTVGEFEDL